MTIPEAVSQKQTRHSRDDVLTAALQLLDRHGLGDLTMRRLGATLDVQPSALYWHFANKQTLLAAVADRIVSPGSRDAPRLPPDGLPASPAGREDAPPNEPGWTCGIRVEAETLRDSLLAYRDGAEVVSGTLALGLGDRLAERRLVDAVRSAGFDDHTSATAASVLLHFILGHVSHEQQRLQADSLGALGDSPDPSQPPIRGDDAFHFGITLLVGGLHTRLERSPFRTVR